MWLLELDGLGTDFEDQCRALMNAQEHERAAAFRVRGARRQFCAGRALCRTMLSHFAPIAPTAWRFELGARGKPRAIAPDGTDGPWFNLAHTDGLVACVVGPSAELGIDTEAVQRQVSLDIADSFFAAPEVAALRAVPAEQRSRRFLELWTLKEAYIKARGLGLSLSLQSFWFDVEGEQVRLAMNEACNDTVEGWHFERWSHRETHLVAVALRPGATLDVRLVTL